MKCQNCHNEETDSTTGLCWRCSTNAGMFTIKTKQENWEKEFDERWSKEKISALNKDIMFFGKEGKKELILPNLEDIKSFIKSTLQAQKQQYEKGFIDGAEITGSQAEEIMAEKVEQAKEIGYELRDKEYSDTLKGVVQKAKTEEREWWGKIFEEHSIAVKKRNLGELNKVVDKINARLKDTNPTKQ